MQRNKAARCRCSSTRANCPRSRDAQIIADYERGSRIAGLMFCAMFVVLTLGCWWFGW